jgi:DNA-binding transcriptional regulator YdaS (Cro superfamily)
MDLRTYFFGLSVEARKTFAEKCDTSPAHLTNIAYGFRKPNPALAIAIERESGGAVTRREMLPDTFLAIWPDLSAA